MEQKKTKNKVPKWLKIIVYIISSFLLLIILISIFAVEPANQKEKEVQEIQDPSPPCIFSSVQDLTAKFNSAMAKYKLESRIRNFKIDSSKSDSLYIGTAFITAYSYVNAVLNKKDLSVKELVLIATIDDDQNSKLNIMSLMLGLIAATDSSFSKPGKLIDDLSNQKPYNVQGTKEIIRNGVKYYLIPSSENFPFWFGISIV